MTLIDEVITKESNGSTGRKTFMSNKGANGDIIMFTRAEFVDDGPFRDYIIAPNGTWVLSRLINADGTGYSSTPMRASPGSSDAVNTKYVLDQVAGMVDYVDGEVGTHVERKDNPHSVTKAQVGLGNVNNTSDAAKPISTATQTALATKANVTDVQSKLTFDDVPVSGSNNPVKSGGIHSALATKLSAFSLYKHTIVITCTEGANFGVSLTVLNQSPTAFTLATLRDYLGSSPDDYKQCSGVGWDGDTIVDLIGIRGGNPGQLIFKGINQVTRDPSDIGYYWIQYTMILVDKVRQIV